MRYKKLIYLTIIFIFNFGILNIYISCDWLRHFVYPKCRINKFYVLKLIRNLIKVYKEKKPSIALIKVVNENKIVEEFKEPETNRIQATIVREIMGDTLVEVRVKFINLIILDLIYFSFFIKLVFFWELSHNLVAIYLIKSFFSFSIRHSILNKQCALWFTQKKAILFQLNLIKI